MSIQSGRLSRPYPTNLNFWSATQAEGLTNKDGSFNRNLYSISTIGAVNGTNTLPTWVDARNKKFGNQTNFKFGSGSDRLILNDKTKLSPFANSRASGTTVSMGSGNDDVTHQGHLQLLNVNLQTGHDRIAAKGASNSTIDLGEGNDIVNIRELDGSVHIKGGKGNDTYRLNKFQAYNSIEDASGNSRIDFTVSKKDASGKVVNAQGYPVARDLFGSWYFTTTAGRNSGTKPFPGKAGRSVNDFNFTRSGAAGQVNLIEKATGETLEMRLGKSTGNQLDFADGRIYQDQKGVWTKEVTIPKPPIGLLSFEPAMKTTNAAPAAAVAEEVKTYKLDDQGEWQEVAK